MFLSLVLVGISALVLHEGAGLAWPAAIVLGVLVNVAISMWGTLTRPRRIRRNLDTEHRQLLASGLTDEAARERAWDYVRNKYKLG
jgi:hypothetical protein